MKRRPQLRKVRTAASRLVHAPIRRRGRANGFGIDVSSPAPHRRIHYTKGVQAHWRDAAVGARGELRLEGLPFEPGEPVEVLVISKTPGARAATDRSLQNSVIEYRDPTEPVTGDDWDALQ